MNKVKKQKTDKQIYTKFALLVIAGFVIGLGLGSGGAFLAENFNGDISQGVMQMMKVCVPVLFVGLNAIVYTFAFVNYFKAKKMLAEWDGIDEDVLEEVEKKIGIAISPSNVMMACNFFLYSAMMYISEFNKPNFSQRVPLAVFGIVFFIITLVLMSTIQKLGVDMIKKINPEKKGNVFDTEFGKDWLASCDELQKKQIGEAAYKAYKATNTVCMVMTIITLMVMMLFDTGIIPSLCVFVIWVSLIGTYSWACYQFDKKK